MATVGHGFDEDVGFGAERDSGHFQDVQERATQRLVLLVSPLGGGGPARRWTRSHVVDSWAVEMAGSRVRECFLCRVAEIWTCKICGNGRGCVAG